ncbi:MAG: hypothetical protein EBU88_16965, partial [Acidobacteria bacterium]|nr:hypothetical protein [Acidobacteriota bacterium]
AESANKKSKAMVTSMLQCAQHLTESFWVKAWEQADLIHSLGSCSQPGRGHMTKYEAIRGRVPDLNQIILLPFGQPVEFHVPKDQRGSFHAKSRAGSYIGADLNHPGAIQVWSHATRKAISTTSFKVKHALPDPDKVFERIMFRDADDLDDTPVTSLVPANELEGPTTRGRSRLIETAELSATNTAGTAQESVIPTDDTMSALSSQEGASASVDQQAVLPQEGAENALVSDVSTSGLLQEGAGTAPSGGPITRSRSSTLSGEQSAPVVITTVTALRQSARFKDAPSVRYEESRAHCRPDKGDYRSLQRSRRLGKRPTTCVAIAESTLPDAGHGLFATRDLQEGMIVYTYGTLRPVENDTQLDIHSADTIFHEPQGISVRNRNRDYGCWCNDPRDQSKVNAHIRWDAITHLYVVKLRWDVLDGDEIFVEYGPDYWKMHDQCTRAEGGFTIPVFE